MRILRCALIGLAMLAPLTVWAKGPTVTLSSTNDHPRATDKVSGTGFSASEAVDIYWDTTDILLAVTDATGKFGPLKFTVPADATPGQHWVTAVGRKIGDAAQAAFAVSTAWSELKFKPNGKSDNSYENVISLGNVTSLDTAWVATTGAQIASSPAVVNGTVFIGSDDHKLYAFDAGSGTTLWTATTGSFIESSPAVANGTVYVGAGSGDGSLYAFDAVTGTEKWATNLGVNGISSSPAVANGVVYVGSFDKNLYALDASTGAALWKATTGGAIAASPAVANGMAYAGSLDGNIYAFNASTGAQVWTASTGFPVSSSAAVADGIVVVASENSYVFGFDAGDGTQLWNLKTAGLVTQSPSAAKDIAYFSSGDGTVDGTVAARNLIGSVIWGQDYGTQIFPTSPVLANGVLYFGLSYSGQGYHALVAVDPANGNIVWSAQIGGFMYAPPVVSDGVVYVGANDGKLYAFALDGGNRAIYRHKHTRPPSYSTLHPNFHLKPTHA